MFFVGTESQKAVINILKRIAAEENDQTSLKLSSVYEKASDIAVLLNKEFNFSKKWEGASDDDINYALLYLTLVETGIKQFLGGQRNGNKM